MKTNRVNEIVNTFTSFKRDVYYKSEELPELFKLQEETVKLTFGADQNEIEKLRIWDVERYFEKKNMELNGAATTELEMFEEDCKDLCNMIKGIISGSRGEAKAFRSLDKLKGTNRIIKNLEITTDDVRTELDAVVITEEGVYIVEVKNTAKNVFIDEDGNYYLTGEYQRWDSNIGAKMTARENVVKQMLSNTGYEDVPVHGVVVFTDNRIEVRNRCRGLTTCFVSQLPYMLTGDRPICILKESDIEIIGQSIETMRCKEAYPIKYDAVQFKLHFAELMQAIEQAEANENKRTVDVKPECKYVQKSRKGFKEAVRKALTPSYPRVAGTVVSLAVRAMTIAVVMKHI